jgi:hypothetical protein
MTRAQEPNGREPDARARRQRSRNLAIAAVLGGLVVLFYVITIVKMSGANG